MNTKTRTFVIALAMMITLTLGISTNFGQDERDTTSIDSSRQDGNDNGNDIVGTWVAVVTIRNCQTGSVIRSFPVLNTFNKGGTMMETSRSLATRSPGQGTWDRNTRHQYSSVFMFFRSNADGTDNGFQLVRRHHTLDGDFLTTEATFENFNAAGVPVSTGCATETAARLK